DGPCPEARRDAFGTPRSRPDAPRPPLSRRDRAHRRCTRIARRTDARRSSLLPLQRPPCLAVPSSGRSLPAPGHERVPDRETPAVDPRFDGPDLDRGDRRDLLVGEALDITKEKGRTLLGGESREGLLDDQEGLPIARDLHEVRAGSRWFRP